MKMLREQKQVMNRQICLLWISSLLRRLLQGYGIKLSFIVKLFWFMFPPVSIRDDPYWTSGKNSLELIELSSINKVSLV